MTYLQFEGITEMNQLDLTYPNAFLSDVDNSLSLKVFFYFDPPLCFTSRPYDSLSQNDDPILI